MTIETLGIDIAKNVFQLHGEGKPVLGAQVRRTALTGGNMAARPALKRPLTL